MDNNQLLFAILAKLTAGKQAAVELTSLLDELTEDERGEISKGIARYDVNTNLQSLCSAEAHEPLLDILPADTILSLDWPEPVWAVPGILPVGLAILAGAPKVGKSWLALQISRAIATGGHVFDRHVELGPILYLALEDPPRRLKQRMLKQSWPAGTEADFMTVGSFFDRIGDLRNGGAEKLARQIEHRGYRLVAIDTLSRAVAGDQNDMADMTAWLTPIHEISHSMNCSIVMIDHHRKSGGAFHDAIADILGSTGKGAMADTAIGLYRERNKAGAKLVVTGREVEEQSIDVSIDWSTGTWQLDSAQSKISDIQSRIVDALSNIGPAGSAEIAEAIGEGKDKRGTIYKNLTDLESKGRVVKLGKEWDIVTE